jgi:hypothetical protein
VRDRRHAVGITLTAIAAILLWAFLARGCYAQDGAQSVVEPIPLITGWQNQIQDRLDAAGKIAAAGNRSIVVTEQPGKYEFVSLDIPPHVFLVFGTGEASREGDLVYVGGDNPSAPLITVRGGYSTGLAGCQIRTKRANEANVVGIKVENAINSVIRNVRVDLKGVDCIGVQIAGRESFTISRLESRASVPIQILWGDNLALRDCDLGASGRVELLPNACVHLLGAPHQITFDGSQTWQGGDHAVFAEVSGVAVKGQNLNLYNVRWEQSTSRDDASKAAIHLRFTPRGFENLVLIGCRWTDRARGFNLAGVDGLTILGSRLPGSR